MAGALITEARHRESEWLSHVTEIDGVSRNLGTSLRIIYASGLDSHYQTEPHVLAGTANPTVAKRNMSLPGENGQNLVEWRFRKEQAQGKVNVFGRKLRVSNIQRVGDVFLRVGLALIPSSSSSSLSQTQGSTFPDSSGYSQPSSH